METRLYCSCVIKSERLTKESIDPFACSYDSFASLTCEAIYSSNYYKDSIALGEAQSITIC